MNEQELITLLGNMNNIKCSKIDRSPYNTYLRLETKSGERIGDIRIKHKDIVRSPREIYPSDAGDSYDCVLQIIDAVRNQRILAALKLAGFNELNHWHCAQWGTWKFIVNEDILNIVDTSLTEE